MLLTMSARHCRVTMTLCSIVLHVCCIMNGPLLVEGELSCYAGSLEIVNGELSVASTKYVTLQQCSSPTTQPPTTNSTATPPSTMKQVTSPQPNTTTNGNAPSVPGGQTTSSGKQTSINKTTTSPPKGSSSTSSVTPALTEPSPTQPVTSASPGSVTPNPSTASATPGGSPVATDGVTNRTTTAHPAATSTLPVTTGDGSLMGCVVVTKTNGSIETASFSCPTPDSACKDIGFNGSAGSDNQTHCFVGSSSNTIDAFINRESVGYSTVDSCFVGTTDAVNETQCGESSNVCLTIKDTLQGDNTTAYYCGNETLQKYCEKDGALREGSFLQTDTNITVLCCASMNCNTPTPSTTTSVPSTPTPNSSQVYTSSSTAAPTSTTSNASAATGSSSSAATSPDTASSTPTPSIPASSSGMSGSTGAPSSTGALRTTGDTSQLAKHSNKILIVGIVSAFVVGLIGGIIVTVIVCRRRNGAAARPGELLAFDSFHYKRMGADEVSNEEVFMT
nr:mucin-2-like [Lytechinus pictus]